MQTLLVAAQLKSMSRQKDASVKLTFQTMREIPTDEFTLMDEYWQKSGWLAFKMNEFDGTEMPKENAVVEGGKTPSQRLRSCLYVKHMKNGGNAQTFPAYYEKAMEGFAQAVIETIPED
jgi:hypothetical protein